jgi:hypothetical protein
MRAISRQQSTISKTKKFCAGDLFGQQSAPLLTTNLLSG